VISYRVSPGPFCADGGICHHTCSSGSCFRQDGCAPLTGSGLTNDWRLPIPPAEEVPMGDPVRLAFEEHWKARLAGFQVTFGNHTPTAVGVAAGNAYAAFKAGYAAALTSRLDVAAIRESTWTEAIEAAIDAIRDDYCEAALYESMKAHCLGAESAERAVEAIKGDGKAERVA